MEETQLDDEMLKRLIECRNSLLWLLADQHPPPDSYSGRLWKAHALVAEVIEEIKRVAGVEEPLGHTGWTIYPEEESP